jgi:cell division protein FtsI/penicillin-binding protein 2
VPQSSILVDVRRSILLAIAGIFFAAWLQCDGQGAGQAAAWQVAAASAARSAPGAEIVVVDLASGHLLAAHRLAEAAHTLAAPGSSLKPIALYGLIENGRWNPERRIACSRTLRIAGRALNCSHPALPPLDARQALAWSCNTYFAAVAGSVPPEELRGVLAPSGLLSATGLAANEATARFRSPNTPDETRLALLGVEGIAVTPLELVRAYRWLGLEFAAHPGTQATETVSNGMKDSASFGMADNANLGGVAVAGKTGTASAERGGQTHGWFAAIAPANAPANVQRVALVVYLPAGHGADAAGVAAQMLARSPLRAR